jgi:hypothetical protein
VDRRGRIRAYGGAVALMLVGVICGFAVPGLVGDIIRLTLLTVGFGAVILAVFYEIGMSEEKALAREQNEREQRQPKHEEPDERSSWTRPPRRPG